MNLFDNILKNVAPATASTNQFLSGFQKPQAQPLVSQVQPGVITSTPKPTPKKPTLFADEQNAYNVMIGDGLPEEEAISLVKKRREQLASGLKLTPIEATALRQMAQDGLGTEESLNILAQARKLQKETEKLDFEKKYSEGNLLQKGAYNALMLGAGATEKVLKYGGNILDFATFGQLGFGEDVKRMQEVTKSPEFDSKAFKAGQVLPDVALAVSPIGGGYLAGAKGVGSLALRSGVVGAGFGAAQPILDKGSEATMGDIGKGAVIGGAIGTVASPLIGVAGKGLIKGAEKAGKYGTALRKGGIEGVGKSIVRDVKGVGQTIGQKYQGTRKYLSGLDEKEISAIEKSSAKELDDIIKQAKETQGKMGDYVQTPYHVGATKAQKTLNQLETDLKTRQSERLSILDEAPIAQIDANDARMALKSSLRSMNVEDIKIVDGVPKIIPVKGREALLDLSNPADVKALQKLNEILDGDVSPTQTMDRIKKLQEWAYENKSTIGVKGTSERMDGLIKKVQGSLNATFKKQLPTEYAKVLDSMSEDIKLSNEIKRVFGIDDMGNPVGNRGEMVMKRLANGTTTGGEARKLAKQIYDRYGIDLVKEARLRQLAMDLVGDERGQTLFGAIQRGKSGIVDLAMQKTLEKIVNKEGVIRSLAKGKGEVIKKTKPIYTPNAFRKAMAEEAKKPKALPAPSGKQTSAKSVGLSPMTSSPRTDAMTGQQGKRPITPQKKESQKLLPAPRLPAGTSYPRTDVSAISMQGLSSNVKRPNGTSLGNSKNTSPSSNTKGSKQKIKKTKKPTK